MQKERLQWLDALRGFTMILVVLNHVAQKSLGQDPKVSMSLSMFLLFRMPLFFFVSGFLAYKASFIWTASNTLSLTWKKIKIQVLPALIFLCLFILLRSNIHFLDAFKASMHAPTKWGYWFTWVLLQMFIIYYIFSYIESLFKKRSWIPITILWVISVVVYATAYMPSWFKYPNDTFFKDTSLIETIYFFHFFLLGNIVHRYWDSWQRLFDSKWFVPIIIILATWGAGDYLNWHILRMQWANLPRTIAMYSLMLLVVVFFRHYKDSFTKDKMLGRTMQYVGTRTLDIYLLHFIFLPTIPEIGTWLNTHRPLFLLDIGIDLCITIPIVAVCLLTSNIIRTSPFLGEWLFGVKHKQ
ncbi:MAG: acyltransferase [Prevotellaceae bacterium]|nr:acyltransferase [Candidatus Faecinaster equi]